jgi:MFS family permease
VLLTLMLIFTLGNAACALAPSYASLMMARVVTAFAHGTFFGVGSVVATGLVAADRRASAIAVMFTGLTVANILGVPFGTWLGQMLGWRATFWAVTLVGVVAMAVIALFVPRGTSAPDEGDWRSDLRALGTAAGLPWAPDHGPGLRRPVRRLHLHRAPPDPDHGFRGRGRVSDPAGLRRGPDRRQPDRWPPGRLAAGCRASWEALQSLPACWR